MTAISVDPTRMYSGHPDHHKIRKIVPKIPAGWETCCIQMSEALNTSGLTINWQKGLIGLQSNGKNYIINVPTMRGYLNGEFGLAENYTGGQFLITTQIIDREGVIMFGDRHVDLWTGNNIHRPDMYYLPAIWEAPSTLRKGVFFWEMGPPTATV